jgi:hypothetical protein
MMGQRIRWRVVVESYPCETCGAPPGFPCVTTSGTPKGEPHAPRSRLASEHRGRASDDPEPEPEP